MSAALPASPLPLEAQPSRPSVAAQRWTTREGLELTLRPVRPEDGPALAAMIAGLSPRARRWRFHGAVNAASADWIARLTHVSSAGQLALVVAAAVDGQEQLVAEGRWVRDPQDPGCAEFALVVADRWQRLGIGQRLLQVLSKAAHEHGLRWLRGEVMHDNSPMCALLRGLQFDRRSAVLEDEESGFGILSFELPVQRLLATPSGALQRLWRRLTA